MWKAVGYLVIAGGLICGENENQSSERVRVPVTAPDTPLRHKCCWSDKLGGCPVDKYVKSVSRMLQAVHGGEQPSA
jgi:hypothetical protein